MSHLLVLFSLFFFNDTPTTEIYTLSLHDALPIFNFDNRVVLRAGIAWEGAPARDRLVPILPLRRKPSAFHVRECRLVGCNHAGAGARFDAHVAERHAAFHRKRAYGFAAVFNYMTGGAICADAANDSQGEIFRRNTLS